MNISSRTTIANEIQRLISAELLDSAERLCAFFISHIGNQEYRQPSHSSESLHNVHAEFYELLGDIVYKKAEVKRALSYYRNASQQRKSNQTFKYRGQTTIGSADDARLRLKECKCLVDLSDYSGALRDIECIPSKFRTAEIHTMLGRLFEKMNLKRQAVASYKEALQLMPLGIELIERLISLRVDAEEITSIISESMRTERQELCSPTSDGWLNILVTTLVQKFNYENEKSLANIHKLTMIYPKNPYLLTLMAEASLNHDLGEQGIACFRQVRRLSPYIFDSMDVFARMLHLKGEIMELNKLANDMLDCCPKQPMGWLVSAIFCFARNDCDTAFEFIDKAIKLNPRCAASYKLKGQLLVSQERHEQALIAYTQANSLEKDIVSFAGMVQTNLLMDKVKDAAGVAREAITSMPACAEAYLISGRVIRQSNQPHSHECLRMFTKALKLNPLNIEATAALAELLEHQNKAEEAVSCLQNTLNKVSNHALRLQLGKLYGSMGHHSEALENLHLSISLNPDEDSNGEAQQEIENIENILRAENEKQKEEDEEDDVEGRSFDGDEDEDNDALDSNLMLDEEDVAAREEDDEDECGHSIGDSDPQVGPSHDGDVSGGDISGASASGVGGVGGLFFSYLSSARSSIGGSSVGQAAAAGDREVGGGGGGVSHLHFSAQGSSPAAFNESNELEDD